MLFCCPLSSCWISSKTSLLYIIHGPICAALLVRILSFFSTDRLSVFCRRPLCRHLPPSVQPQRRVEAGCWFLTRVIGLFSWNGCICLSEEPPTTDPRACHIHRIYVVMRAQHTLEKTDPARLWQHKVLSRSCFAVTRSCFTPLKLWRIANSYWTLLLSEIDCLSIKFQGIMLLLPGNTFRK